MKNSYTSVSNYYFRLNFSVPCNNSKLRFQKLVHTHTYDLYSSFPESKSIPTFLLSFKTYTQSLYVVVEEMTTCGSRVTLSPVLVIMVLWEMKMRCMFSITIKPSFHYFKFVLFWINLFCIFKLFWCTDIKNKFFKNIIFILMYF
jgi:hypothetical protein